MAERPLFQRLEVAEDRPDLLSWQGFLRLSRHWVRGWFDHGQAGPWYQVETAHPPFMDAVVLCLYWLPPQGGPQVLLRRGVRPATALRGLEPALRQADGGQLDGSLWELPAGGVEPHDLEPDGVGIRGRARLEAWEEAGIHLGEEAWVSLGPSPFATPAFCPERLIFLAALVPGPEMAPPQGDGHPMEEGAEPRWVDLAEALDWCRQGAIVDLKTEVGLRRLAEHLGPGLE